MTYRRLRSARSPFQRVRQLDDPEGGVRLELHAEGQRVASAGADADAVSDMDSLLGVDRRGLRSLLESALVERFELEQGMVDLGVPRVVAQTDAASSDDRRLVSQYVRRGPESIAVGVVWYDPSSDTTGPDSVHAAVRSKMRTAARRQLAEKPRSAVQVVVELLDAMSS